MALYICRMVAGEIIAEWKQGSFKPVYWLEGEESYFIDQVMDYAEHHILTEAEQSFNLSIFYGKDSDPVTVMHNCMKYPMMGLRQVVLLKEAQMMRDVDKLEHYIKKPLQSTVLVVAYKEKKVDGRSSFGKLVKNTGYFYSKKLSDWDLPKWIGQMIQEQGVTMSPKAQLLLADHTGNDLSRLQNEVEKIKLNLKDRTNITEDDIELFTGISKEFNVFELQAAIAARNMARAIRIIQYFEANPKAGPIQLILPTLYSFFSKLCMIASMEKPSEATVRGLFYNNSFAAKEALHSYQLYGYSGVEQCILLLHHYNLRSIGVGDTGTENASLLKEMVYKMMRV